MCEGGREASNGKDWRIMRKKLKADCFPENQLYMEITGLHNSQYKEVYLNT